MENRFNNKRLILSVHDAFVGYLLPVGLIFSTATQIRIYNLPLGFGELLLILWVLIGTINIYEHKKVLFGPNIKPFVRFWIIGLVLLFIGFAKLYLASAISKEAYHDIFAFIFIFALINTAGMMDWDQKDAFRLLKRVTNCAFIIYSLVFAISLISPSSLKNYFWYGGERFTALANNPNQIGLAISVLPFFEIYIFKKEINWLNKLWCLFSILIIVIIGIFVKSDALLLAWAVGIILFILLTLLNILAYNCPNLYLSAIKYIALPILLTTITIIYGSEIMFKAIEIGIGVYEEGGQGSIRILLWGNGINAILFSPIIGNGPGSHSGIFGPFQNMESHNTFIDWGSNTGIIGLISYIVLLISVIIVSIRGKDNSLVASIVVLIVYTIFHYAFRQPIFWFYMIIITYLASSNFGGKRVS